MEASRGASSCGSERSTPTRRAGLDLADHDFEAAHQRLSADMDGPVSEEALLADALYPKVFKEYRAFRREFGPIDHLPTPAVLFGLEVGEQISVEIQRGKTLVVKLMAVGGLSGDGDRHVYFELNGQPREVSVTDLTAAEGMVLRAKADPSDPHHVGASMPGKIISMAISVGDTVNAGDVVMVAEAMKMETSVTATATGVIQDILVTTGDSVKAGDLLAVIQ